MPAPEPPTAALRRQVQAVRRRWNLHLVQSALAAWVAAAAGAATVVVLAGVRGGPIAFAVVAGGALLVTAGAAVGCARRVRRRWLRRTAAPAWVDAARDLRGRVASALELEKRGRGDLFDLLLRQTLDARVRWRPEDVVPEVVPARSFALALLAVGLLALIVTFAPRLGPAAPRLIAGDRRMDFVRTGESPEGAERILVGPGREQPAPGSGAAAPDEVGPDQLAEAAAAIQDWLRDALGVDDAWESGDDGAAPGPDAESAQAAAPRPRGARPGAAADGADPGGTVAQDTDGDAVRPATGEGGEPGGGGPGAGDGTDPRLYGAADEEPGGPRDRFELAIAARVRTRRGSALAPWTTAPTADADRNPALAGGQRLEQPAHRMPVPAPLAPVVGRAYAHAAPGVTP